MRFSEKSARRKKSRDLKNELKELRKEMVSGGLDKSETARMLAELQAALELGDSLHSDYEEARAYTGGAREDILKLLESMNASPAGEVKESLAALAENLEKTRHDCLIREDDLDFRSTVDCLKRMAQEFDGSAAPAIMLRSELENVKAVLDDAAGFKAPDFLALAYYYLHEDRKKILEMENEQRNQMLSGYFEGHFMNEFCGRAERAGARDKVMGLIDNYINNN